MELPNFVLFGSGMPKYCGSLYEPFTVLVEMENFVLGARVRIYEHRIKTKNTKADCGFLSFFFTNCIIAIYFCFFSSFYMALGTDSVSVPHSIIGGLSRGHSLSCLFAPLTQRI